MPGWAVLAICSGSVAGNISIDIALALDDGKVLGSSWQFGRAL